mgnify:CR=1 FL=1
MSNEEKDLFIAEAVKDLDAEAQVHASVELEQQIGSNSQGLSQTTERLGNTPVRKFSPGRIGLIVLLIVSFVMMMTVRNTSPVVAYKDFRLISIYPPEFSPIEFTLEESRVIYDGLNASGAKLLWESNPEKTGLYAHYLERYHSENNTYPEGFLDTVKKIEPENGLYHILYAADYYKAIEQAKTYRKLRKELSSIERGLEDYPKSHRRLKEQQRLTKELVELDHWEIKDQQKFEKAVALLKEGISKPTNTESAKEYKELVLTILASKPKYVDLNEKFQNILTIASIPLDGSLKFLKSSQLLAAHYEWLSKHGQKELIEWWVTHNIKYWHQRMSEMENLIEFIVLRAEMNATYPAMIKAVQHAEWDEMEKRLVAFGKALKNDNEVMDERSNHYRESAKRPMLLNGNHIEYKLIVPLTFSDDIYRAGRLSEHALIGRFFMGLGWAILGITLFTVWIYRFARKTIMTPIGMNLCGSLTSRDWIVILLGGVLSPIIFYWLLTHFTDLSAREWNIAAAEGTATIGQPIAMILSIISLSLCILRWRMSKVLPAIVRSASWLAWLMAGASFLAMILGGLIDTQRGIICWTMCGLLGLVALYLLVIASSFTIKRPTLEKYTVNRALTPVLAVAMLMMTILAACFYETEKHYVATDPLLSLDPNTGWSHYETMVTQQMKKELQERLKMLGPIDTSASEDQ